VDTSGKKSKLSRLLVERGFFDTEREALPWIMAGQVLVAGQRVDKAGTQVPEDSPIRIKGYHEKYVSRGGYKLEAALNCFDISVIGRTALDCGASTGGFTDCLLRHGCQKVYAIDVGYGQLAGKLRVDDSVVN